MSFATYVAHPELELSAVFPFNLLFFVRMDPKIPLDTVRVQWSCGQSWFTLQGRGNIIVFTAIMKILKMT